MTMICVTHEMGFARSSASYNPNVSGIIVEEGLPDEFSNNPKHERTRKFLGEILAQ
jgi:polar amino acid transport system ATP-binding protein